MYAAAIQQPTTLCLRNPPNGPEGAFLPRKFTFSIQKQGKKHFNTQFELYNRLLKLYNRVGVFRQYSGFCAAHCRHRTNVLTLK